MTNSDSTNNTQQTTADAETEPSTTHAVEQWLKHMLDDQQNAIHQALSTEEKTLLQDILNGALWNSVTDKFNSAIDLETLPEALATKQANIAALMNQKPTVDTIVNRLFEAVDQLMQSGVKTLEELALFCSNLLYSLLEIIIKLLRRVDISELLPDWMAQRISGGENISALSLFLAMPASTLKSLLDAASRKNNNQ